jgi:hypothetical protein
MAKALNRLAISLSGYTSQALQNLVEFILGDGHNLWITRFAGLRSQYRIRADPAGDIAELEDEEVTNRA